MTVKTEPKANEPEVHTIPTIDEDTFQKIGKDAAKILDACKNGQPVEPAVLAGIEKSVQSVALESLATIAAISQGKRENDV